MGETAAGSSGSSPPTKTNIRDAFAEVQRQAGPSNVLLVYFSGHGVNVHGDHHAYYYLTEDARTFDMDHDATLRDASTVSSAELREWLSGERRLVRIPRSVDRSPIARRN